MTEAGSFAKQALLEIDPDILLRISKYDLTKVSNLTGSEVISTGASCDVLKFWCTIDGREQIVAGKRLRFYLDSPAFKQVRIVICIRAMS